MIKNLERGQTFPFCHLLNRRKKRGEGGQSNKALKLSEFYFSFVYSSGAINFDLKL